MGKSMIYYHIINASLIRIHRLLVPVRAMHAKLELLVMYRGFLQGGVFLNIVLPFWHLVQTSLPLSKLFWAGNGQRDSKSCGFCNTISSLTNYISHRLEHVCRRDNPCLDQWPPNKHPSPERKTDGCSPPLKMVLRFTLPCLHRSRILKSQGNLVSILYQPQEFYG